MKLLKYTNHNLSTIVGDAKVRIRQQTNFDVQTKVWWYVMENDSVAEPLDFLYIIRSHFMELL